MHRPYTHCEWLIAPGYAPIGLTFTHFSLATNDTLSVYDSETANPTRLIGVYTGMAPLKSNCMSNANSIIVRWAFRNFEGKHAKEKCMENGSLVRTSESLWTKKSVW